MKAAQDIIEDLSLLEAPLRLPWWGWALAVLALAGIVLAVKLIGRRRPPAPVEVTPREAVEDALAELANLRDRLATRYSRAYGIAVSGIVRRYIERRFGIRAPRRSTEEFLVEAGRSDLLEEKHRKALGVFLRNCDFLKFARGYAEVHELEAMHNSAVAFVKETMAEKDGSAGPSGAGGGAA